MNKLSLKKLEWRSWKVILSAALFWLPLIAFFKIADGVREREAVRADSAFLEWLHGFATPALDRAFVFVTNLGNAATVIVVAACVAAYLSHKKLWRSLIFFVGSVGGAAAADALLKIFFHRARPSLWSPITPETDYSFPSGHAMITVALVLSLNYLLWDTRARWPAVALGTLYVLAVGFSRLYLGVHFPTDVVAGWCASTIWVAAAAKVSHRPRLSQHPAASK